MTASTRAQIEALRFGPETTNALAIGWNDALDAVLAIIPADPQPAPVEPEAWIFTHAAGSIEAFRQEDIARLAAEDAGREMTVQPLYAHPPRASQTTPPEDVANTAWLAAIAVIADLRNAYQPGPSFEVLNHALWTVDNARLAALAKQGGA